MALIREDQVRHILVGSTAPVLANIAALKAAANTTIGIFQPNGNATAANTGGFFATKNNKGTITSLDVIMPEKVMYATSKQGVARTAKTVTVSDITVEAGKLYTIAIVISGHGSLSIENEYVKEGFYKAKAGDNAENIVDGLIKSLARGFTREPVLPGTFTSYTEAGGGTVNLIDNYSFAFSKTGTGTTAALVITEKNWLPSYYVTGKKDKLVMPFRVEARFDEVPTITVVEGNKGVGTGYEVRNLEYYLLGNRQDTFRGMGYPHNFDVEYDSSLTTLYNLIEIGYYDEGRDDPMKSKKQLTIAIPGDAAAVNPFITRINTALGTSIASLT